jgi:putative intracellular protease/amidase
VFSAGTCTDFWGNEVLTAKVEAAWKAGKVVAADCHGPIGLLGCKKEDGTPLIAGKKVTGTIPQATPAFQLCDMLSVQTHA